MSSIRFSPEILKRLGEELVPNLDQAVLELVRNAYDADAATCTVILEGTTSAGGRLTVLDDGVGMTLQDIENGWLLIGKSRKSGRTRTKRFKRSPVGDKGLGRLSALRAGTNISLVTRPKSEPGREFTLSIDWRDFERATAVEDVPLSIERRTRKSGSGTILQIHNLKKRVTERDASRIARALLLLADPFSAKAGFKTKLVANEYPDQVQRVERGYLDEARLNVRARVDGRGRSSAVVRSATGRILYQATHSELTRKNYKCPSATFELWEFKLEAASFSPKADITAVREWLRLVGGVHVYHRGLRVLPYGDPGHDWLDMNLKRVSSPELRPSTNNSIGRLIVADPKEQLTQKTDRTGFFEDESFQELRRFATDVLNWMADERIRERDSKKKKQKQELSETLAKARTAVDSALSGLPVSRKKRIRRAVAHLERVRDRESESIREELQLYRTLATVGTTASAFAHETAPCVDRIEDAAQLIQESVSGDPTLFERDTVAGLIGVIVNSATSLQSMAEMPLRLLAREKRSRRLVNLNNVARSVVSLFEPINLERKISVDLDLDEGEPEVFASVAAIESVLTNLLTNAITSHVYGKKRGKRIIQVMTFVDPRFVQLIVRDNGRGIRDIDEERIWLPGRTTKNNGTGLGLTIVRDTVADLGGEVWLNNPGELGGADFCIQFNRKEDR